MFVVFLLTPHRNQSILTECAPQWRVLEHDLDIAPRIDEFLLRQYFSPETIHNRTAVYVKPY